MVQIIEDEFGRTKQPSSSEEEIVKRFTFSNGNGVSIQVNNIKTVDTVFFHIITHVKNKFLDSYIIDLESYILLHIRSLSMLVMLHVD